MESTNFLEEDTLGARKLTRERPGLIHPDRLLMRFHPRQGVTLTRGFDTILPLPHHVLTLRLIQLLRIAKLKNTKK